MRTKVQLLLMLALVLGARTVAASPLVDAARGQVGVTLIYDPAYVRLNYPLGDVPIERGVCSDVLIRALRVLGLDLQQRVHEDMRAHFSSYPPLWGLSRPDRNIDHRRVPNLETWLRRQGAEIAKGDAPTDFQPGDIVSWRLPGNLPHIGIVSDRMNAEGRPLILHNIGAGTQEQDVLFAWPITAQFRLPVSLLEASARG
jgi:uncharacterized protein YijF (DUF1287 family)